MNKLTKAGVSALCGSLAAVASANAGDVSVTGGVDMSWMNIEDGQTGNPIGVGSNISFSGSGELDNGISFALSVAHGNKNVYSNTNVIVTWPGVGDIRIDQGTSGTGIDRMDDLMPTAWEEAYGHGIGSGIDTVGGVSGSANIEYTPSMMPDGVTLRVAYSPNASAGNNNDKASSGAGGFKQAGFDVTGEVTSLVDGLKLFAGYSEIDVDKQYAKYDDAVQSEWTAGFTYAVGGLTVGYQYSFDDKNQSDVNSYENDAYGVSFNINDDLTISYGKYESKQDHSTSSDITNEATSMQVSYSVGGASIRLADGDIDNANYSTLDKNDKNGQTLSVSLAF